MKKKVLFSTIFGAAFLAIGALWLSVIFIRSGVHFDLEKSRGDAGSEVSYREIENRIAEKIEEKEGEGSKTFSLRKHVPKTFIWQFWLIACLELLCALLFLVSGVALLRRYAFRRRFVLLTLAADMALKVLIWTYYHFIFLPLNEILDGKNILLMYFSPDAAVESKLSLYLSGAKLAGRGALYYACVYLVLWLAAVTVFTRLEPKD